MQTLSVQPADKSLPMDTTNSSMARRGRRKTDVSGLRQLELIIAEHRAADIAFGKAIDRKNDTELAYEKAFPPKETIIMNLLGGGVSMSAGYDACKQGISDMYDRRRQQIQFLDKLDPKLLAKALSALGKVYQKNMVSIYEQFAEIKAQEERFGLGRVNRAYDKASDRERASLAAVCAHECQTIEEVKAKAGYLLRDGVRDAIDPDMMDVLLESMTSPV